VVYWRDKRPSEEERGMKFLKKLFQGGKADRSEAVQLPAAPSEDVARAFASPMMEAEYWDYVSTYHLNDPLRTPKYSAEEIVLSPATQLMEDEFLDYVVSYEVNASFRPAKSHAGEVELLCTYAPGQDMGREAAYPCICLLDDDTVYSAIEEFQERGTFEGALELEPLSGQFLFRAKREYFDNLMYFYALVQEEGFFQQAGLCLIYSKAYGGTEDEKKLMSILDAAAESFKQESCWEDEDRPLPEEQETW